MRYTILLFLLIMSACGGDYNNQSEHLRHVGDIPFDSSVDDSNYQPCQEDLALVHYNFNNPNIYEGEKPAIVRAFDLVDLPKKEGQTGFVTVRFMVNCKGETGRFRVEQLDVDYKAKTFDAATVDAILATTKSLDAWVPATYDGKAYDYYKYLTFKMIDNQIVDILP